MIRSVLVWVATWSYLTVAALIGIPYALVTRRISFMYAEARLGIRVLLRLAGIEVHVHGQELLHKLPRVLYMCNHQSSLDPPSLLLLLPGQVSVLAKKELFRVPVLGTVMRVGGLVPVDRSNKDAAHASVDRAAEELAKGRPFFIFPEGTRSRDGRLLPFKKGPFIMAEKGSAVIVPITITGTRALMRKGSIRIRSGRVDVYVHSPVDPAAFSSREELMAAVGKSIDSVLPVA